jgi:enoyl-CoA hydratase
MNAQTASSAAATADWTCFKVEIANHIAHVQLNRPEVMNALNRTFWNELPAIIKDINDNARARVIVISSTGKHFTAGMDLSVFTEGGGTSGEVHAEVDRATTSEAMRAHVAYLQNSFSCLDEARMPVLAAVHGACIGAGVDMTSACDIRYATADAFFCIQEINIGMTADVGTFPRLCKLIPEGWVREMAYTGRRVPAAKAREIGLVNEVFDTHEAMMAHVMTIAREIAEKPPLAVTGSKVMINYARDHTLKDGLDYIAVWQTGMFSPQHMMEAFAAKREKRPGNYPDLLPLRNKM